jgi:hypothetical protein
VVEVDLDLGDAAPGEAGERVEPGGLVLLAGEEERVPRTATVGVVELGGEARILLFPEAHASVGLRLGDLVPQRLPVIAEREEQVAGARDRRSIAVRAVRPNVARVSLDPGVEALLAEVVEHGVHATLPL